MEESLMTRSNRGKQRLCETGARRSKKVDKKTTSQKKTLA
ncbi:hypothetical protein D047_2905 [Vibrio parahaemolyticus VPTS-2010_2]|nr:hypothetical protein D047_2905 [Vibrio parahaemolyticus VPTS-2010_2]